MHVELVAQGLLIVAGVAALGWALGEIGIGGAKLGVGGVLFAGLAAGHFGFSLEPSIHMFLRDFGLVLFVYATGVAIGPGFFEAFKRDGLVFNALAIAVVLIGTATAVVIHFAAGLELPATLGMLSGATTNTPSLAAGQQVLRDLGAADAVTKMGTAYAVAYPFGVIGILVTMAVIRAVFRLDTAASAKEFEQAARGGIAAVERGNIEICNPAVVGLRLGDLDELKDMGVVISRIMRAGEQHVASDDQILAEGDIVHAVGPRDRLARLLRLLGAEAKVDLREIASNDIRWERVVVTRPAVLGKTLADLDLREQYEVVVTRATRAGYDLVTGPTFRLQFGDILTVVGDPRAIAAVGEIIGNRLRALQDTQMVPVFAGIALGVVIGTIPFALPGLPVPVKLGLAGGPLLTAIALARIGHIGPAVWYMPPAANRMMREFGISLFLAVVGLQSGAGFVDTLVNGNGLAVMACGAIVTLVPLLTVGLAGLWLTRANYLSICGILAGSMTDPPALAFAQSMSGSEAPTLSYATVYPIVMVLRVVIPQFIALALWTV